MSTTLKVKKFMEIDIIIFIVKQFFVIHVAMDPTVNKINVTSHD